VALLGGRTAVEPADAAARADALFAAYARPGSPGCAAGVMREGALVFAKGYGSANLDYDIPITPRTVFDIGSVSKQFTAAGIFLLARDGRLSLDDNVRKWVPELPDYGTPITIRHLLHHTSGLRDYLVLMELAGLNYEDIHPEPEILGLIARQRALNFRPGGEHLYSNSGYLLLAVIGARAAGEPFGRLLARRIFEPLGMTSTRVFDDRTAVVRNRAVGYSPAGAGFRVDYYPNFDLPGDGQVYTTVEDFAKWDRNFDEPMVGGRALVDDLLRRGRLADGREIDYAGALVHGRYRGLPTVGHGGSWAGFRAHYLRFPGERLSVAVLCNLRTADPAALARGLADIWLGDRLGPPDPEAPRRGAGADDEGRGAAGGEETAGIRLEEYAGRFYSDELDATYTLTVERGSLVARVRWRGPRTLVPAGRDRFRLGAATLAFERRGGRVTGFAASAGRVREIRFARVEPAAPSNRRALWARPGGW
jgi:CubicO group peptidase (beta-lactamase class C family)